MGEGDARDGPREPGEDYWAARGSLAGDATREAPPPGRRIEDIYLPPARVTPFKSPTVRGRVLQLWLVGQVFVDVAFGILSAIHLGLLEDGAYTDPAQLDKLAASDDRLALLGVAAIVVFLVTAVFFIAWFNRAYRNLPALGCRDRRWGTGWTIGAWFIPIAAWIIPKQIANEIWRCSVDRDQAREREIPLWVHLWWVLYVIGTLLGNLSVRVYGDGNDIDDERTSTLIDLVATPIYIASAVLCWLVVDRISKAQDAGGAALGTET